MSQDQAPQEAEAARAPGGQPQSARAPASWWSWLLWHAARLGLTFGLVAYVIHQTNWSEVRHHLTDARPGWLTLFALLTPALLLLRVWLWRLLLSVRGHHVPFGHLFGIYMLGRFYMHVLPSSTGGDLVRLIAVQRRIGTFSGALASIVVERFVGLSVLVVLTLGAIALTPSLWERQNLPLMALVAVSVGLYLGLLATILNRRLVALLRRLCGRFRFAAKALDKAEQFQQGLLAYGQHRGVLVQVLGVSLVFYACAILNVYFACHGVGYEDVSLGQLAVAVPVVLAVTLLPLTLGGVGFAEWAFSAAFAAVGLSPAVGLTAALLSRAKELIASSAGYVLYMVLISRSTRAPTATATGEAQPEPEQAWPLPPQPEAPGR